MKNNILFIFVLDNVLSFIYLVIKFLLFLKYLELNIYIVNKIVIKLRGEKGLSFEGGLRVFVIMRLFGIILENVELNVVILLMDIYFIVLDYYNFEKIVYDRVIDGKSLYFVFKDLNFFFFNLFYD